MRFDILSLFPEYFTGPFSVSMIKRALNEGLIEINLVNIRDFADNRHKTVDDRPYGGGPGMVMMPEPVAKAIRSVRKEGAKVIYLSPQGRKLDAALSRELAQYDHLILLCGHYEGIDERVLESDVDEEISIGDYVLTNGCIASIVLLDAVCRFIPDFLGHEGAADEDSFEDGLFDCPHYTRPEIFEGKAVPQVLLSGHHSNIAEWRKAKASLKTKRVRPEIYRNEKKQEKLK